MSKVAIQRPELKELRVRALNMAKLEETSMLLRGSWHWLADAAKRTLELMEREKK